MAKTKGKTSFVVSQPMMMGGGKDYQKSGQSVRGITDGIGVEGGRRQNTSPDSYEEPVSYVLRVYRELRDRIGLFRDSASVIDLLNRAGLYLSLVERDWYAVSGLMRNGNTVGFVVRGQNDLIRNLNSAGLDLEQAAVRMGPRSVTSLADQDLFANLMGQLQMYRARLLSMSIDPTNTAWDYLWNMRASYDPSTRASYDPSTRASYDPSTRASYDPSTRASQDSLNEPSIADAREKVMNPVNTWVKQTGFQAPSPLTPTKGSKGLLGNCSTAGQVVTGLVVGGAIFALYKTCKK